MVKNNPKDTGKIVAYTAIAGVAGYVIYKLVVKPEEPGVPSKLTITGYQNLKTGVTATAPNILDVDIDDTIRIKFTYGYFGPAISGKYHVAVWKPTFGQPYDEFASKDEAFTLPETLEKEIIEKSIDLEVQSWDMTPDMYGIYVKIMGIPGGDIHSYLANTIRVAGGGPGDGWLPGNTELARKMFSFSVGTEIPPGTWLPSNTILARKSFSFTVLTDIPPGTWLPAGTILARRLFSIVVTETPIEYYTVNVASSPLISGWVVQEPDKDKYAYGEIVKLTAKGIWPYKFNYWDFNGEWLDNYSPINFMVTRNGTVTAHFIF